MAEYIPNLKSRLEFFFDAQYQLNSEPSYPPHASQPAQPVYITHHHHHPLDSLVYCMYGPWFSRNQGPTTVINIDRDGHSYERNNYERNIHEMNNHERNNKKKKEEDEVKNPLVYIIAGTVLLFVSAYFIIEDPYVKKYLSGIDKVVKKIEKKKLNNNFSVELYNKWHNRYQRRALRSFLGKLSMSISALAFIGFSFFKKDTWAVASLSITGISGFCIFVNKLVGAYQYQEEAQHYWNFREMLNNLH